MEKYLMAAAAARRVFVLSGAGLSRASGIPTFRDADGLWQGHRVEDVATPKAWRLDPERVLRFYQERRAACAEARPNPAHEALARWQQAWGKERVHLITQNVDGLLQRAGAPEVLEMHGSLFEMRCSDDELHPVVSTHEGMPAQTTCAVCRRALRPNVVWFGEIPLHLDRIYGLIAEAEVLISVGTSGMVQPAASFVGAARHVGAITIEVNPAPVRGVFHHVVAERAEVALPALVEAVLAG